MKELISEFEEAQGVVPFAEGQEKLFNGAAHTADANTTASHTREAQLARGSVDALLEEMMGDAPLCDTCGHITVRNGSCYRCLNCGNSMGCS